MFWFSIFKSRKEKEMVLIEIIKKLNISDLEKEMYTLSLEVLDDGSFHAFFIKITSQTSLYNEKQTIEPLTWNLI